MYGTFFQVLEAAIGQALGGAWTQQMAKAWQHRVEDLLHEAADAYTTLRAFYGPTMPRILKPRFLRQLPEFLSFSQIN